MDTDPDVDKYGNVDTYAHLDQYGNMDGDVYARCANGGGDATADCDDCATHRHYATACDLDSATGYSGGYCCSYSDFCTTPDAHDSILWLAALSEYLLHSGDW
jgi:hypothetical protein